MHGKPRMTFHFIRFLDFELFGMFQLLSSYAASRQKRFYILSDNLFPRRLRPYLGQILTRRWGCFSPYSLCTINLALVIRKRIHRSFVIEADCTRAIASCYLTRKFSYWTTLHPILSILLNIFSPRCLMETHRTSSTRPTSDSGCSHGRLNICQPKKL